MEPFEIIMIVVGVLVGIISGFALGIVSFKKKYKDADEKIKNADNEALRIYNERISSGESRKKELLLEAKDEIHKLRTEHDKEVKERRSELSIVESSVVIMV